MNEEKDFTPLFLQQHYLAIVLDDKSQSLVQSLAKFEDVRGDHVTLAYAREGDRFSNSWIPGGRKIGEWVEIKTLSIFDAPCIQVLLVAIDDSTQRPFDGRKFHITVSKECETESNSANDVLEDGTGKPLELQLFGIIRWVEKN